MKKLKEVNNLLKEVNGLSARFKKVSSDENRDLLKDKLSELRTLLNEVADD